MKTIRIAQALSVAGVAWLLTTMLVLLAKYGYAGGIYGSNFAPLFIFSPFFFGLVYLLPYSSTSLKNQTVRSHRKAKVFLSSLGLQLTLVAIFFLLSRGTADEAVSISIFTLISPLIFFLSVLLASIVFWIRDRGLTRTS